MKKAIVLCGTRPHIDLITNLKKRGFYVILVDFADFPIAKEYANLHLVENAFDKDKVFEVALEFNVDLVISVASDQAYVVSAYVMEKLGKYTPVSYMTVKGIADKTHMKNRMINNGIPTSKYISVNSLQNDLVCQLKYPLIVKPVDTYGSKGVRKATSFSELESNFASAMKYSKKKVIIVEEFIEGIEIGLDCLIKDSIPKIVITRQRIKISEDVDSTQQIYGSIWPADISESVNAKILEVCKKIVEAYNLVNSALMMQLILDKNYDIYVIEFALRIGGGENFNIIKLSTKFDIVDSMIDMFLGNNFSLDFQKPKSIFSDNIVYCKADFFGDFIIKDKSFKDDILALAVHKKRGMKIVEDLTSSNRIATFILKDDTIDNLIQKTCNSFKKFDVCNLLGNSILLKDLHIKKIPKIDREVE
jgi:phosphoribosylamine-glycine ligase